MPHTDDKGEKKKLSKKKEQEVIDEAREHLQDAHAYESDFRTKFVEDLRFTYEDEGQWEDLAKNSRVGRPCYTFNRTEGAIDQVVGDQRQARPGIIVRAGEGGDKKLAEVQGGLIRNIENNSDSETVYDHAFTYAVAGGYGAWRVVNEYNSDDAFEQDLFIREVADPLTVYFDPRATDICKRDGRRCLLTTMISEKEFEDTYPGKMPTDFITDQPEGPYWYHDKEVRVAEYYRKIIKPKTLLQFSDGTVSFEDDVSNILDELAVAQVTVTKSREVKANVIEWYKLFGDGILEGPIEYPWKYIPVVPVYGKRINIEGEYKIKGLTRNAKDPQRSYNYIRSVITEKALLAPKFNYILTPEEIKGYKEWWDNAHSSASPYILYNPDPATGNQRPTPAAPSPVPIELVTIAQMDADDIKAATGFFDASLGNRSNETSGVAIRERKQEGDVGSFVYMDNLSKAIKYTGEILVDMIPKIYDTERTIRTLGVDGVEDYVVLNQTIEDRQTGQKTIKNDLSQGKYDVAVSVGPSYTTQRQETAATLTAIGQQFPEIYTIGADIIVNNLDIPGSEEIEKRFRRLLIQRGIAEPTQEEIQEESEKPPKEPSPEEVLALEKLKAELENEQADTEAKLAKAEEDRAEAAAQLLENEAVSRGLEIVGRG